MLVLTISPKTLLIAGVVVLVIAFAVANLVVQILGKTNFRKYAESLSEPVHNALQEIDSIFIQSHIVKDEDVCSLENKYVSLKEVVELLNENKYLN